MPTSHRPHAQSCPAPTRHRWSLAAVALSASLLAACTSTPLPPWPQSTDSTQAGGPALDAGAGTAQPNGNGAPALEAGAQTTPVATSALQSGSTDDQGNALPYGSAVAARFAAPAVHYDTPGLQANRRAFTTNAELSQWLTDLAAQAQGGTRAQLLNLGLSQRGSALQALVLTQEASASAAALQASQRPTVLLVGQQHGDEPASAEALLVIARELAQGLLEPLLARINVIVVPRANPDGAEGGEHATADGTDLDRDHLLLATPEARALARLADDYGPAIVVDAHEYPAMGRFAEIFGAAPREDLLVDGATVANEPEFLHKATREWLIEPMQQALQSAALRAGPYWRASAQAGDPHLLAGSTRADALRNASALKTAASLAIHSHGSDLGRAELQRRVHAQVTALSSVLHSAMQRAEDLAKVRTYVERNTAAQACHGQAVIAAAPTTAQRELLALDLATGEDRALQLPWDGAPLRALHERPQACGYWLAADARDAAQRLRTLGLQVMRVAENGSVLVDSWRALPAGHLPLTAQSQPQDAPAQLDLVRNAIDVPAGSYYLPLNQPLAWLAVAALEADAPSSYLSRHLLPDLAASARVMGPTSLIFEGSD
ncbi:M14 family zinc carboxypeptidase [Comamonas faecalis]|uniref:M14 family zinc carboxypeptidase n=1 Tax=Comamonas faecalis TaxID=1387849 RepID=UPI000C9EF186